MPTPSASELERLFGAYLNADWPAQYGSVEVALDAYCAEADDAQRRATVSEFDAVLAAHPNERDVARELAERGNEYAFEDDESPRAFATAIRTRIAASLDAAGPSSSV